MKELWDRYHDEDAGKDLIDNDEFWAFDDKADATRNISGKIINRIKDYLPNLLVVLQTKLHQQRHIWKMRFFLQDNYGGRNIHFGVRNCNAVLVMACHFTED